MTTTTHSSSADPIRFTYPPIFAVDRRAGDNSIRQLILPSGATEATARPYVKHRVKGLELTPANGGGEPLLAILNTAKPPAEFARVVRVPSDKLPEEAAGLLATLTARGPRAKWIRHPLLPRKTGRPLSFKRRLDRVRASWQGAFAYLEEDKDRRVAGLRPPQIGAVHAAHAHWAVSDEPATVVMPTGTGKTETMLSILISERCEKLLVVVPTDALRTQIANKFLSLGILKRFGIVAEPARYPVVGVLKHKPQNRREVRNFFAKCSVVVTTMSIAGQCNKAVQKCMAELCPYLFVDEAHHVAAPTWRSFKERFESSRILQFTATPFRNDDRPIGGKIIFNYPIRKAQEEEIFGPIRFEPVIEFDPDKADEAIAKQAVERLCAEYEKGLPNILMARVATIKRARQVRIIYQSIYEDTIEEKRYLNKLPGSVIEEYRKFEPLAIHTDVPSGEREKRRQRIVDLEAKIVICVDMLGEGFDLPELKIAAFHDVRKSLPVTLQLAGRFIRDQRDPDGRPIPATFIANIAEVEVKDELRKLYAQDADWNHLLGAAGAIITRDQIDLAEFVAGFPTLPGSGSVPLQNLRPMMSTIVYRTACEDWTPESFKGGLSGSKALDFVEHNVNAAERTLVIVTAKKEPIDWARVVEIYNRSWELYVLYWDKDRNLLFIHSSGSKSFNQKLACAVAGRDAARLQGLDVFKCFGEIKRLKFHSVGLLESPGLLIRYTMRAGADVEPGIGEVLRGKAEKSNMFGTGFEAGRRTTIGCSRKGRIWSHRTDNMKQLVDWFDLLGEKITSLDIDPNKILEGTLRPKVIAERPRKMPIGIEWPEVMYRNPETAYKLDLGGGAVPLYQAGVELVAPATEGELRFRIFSDGADGSAEGSVELTLDLKSEIRRSGARNIVVKDYDLLLDDGGRSRVSYRGRSTPLAEFFYLHPPRIWFEDGSSLEGNSYVELRDPYAAYPASKIVGWDWTGVDITKESQGTAKTADSIQYRVIQTLKAAAEPYSVIFDDDAAGEAADVVTVRLEDTARGSQEKIIKIELYHLKFSSGASPGHRVKDVYEVCGQAQKSIHWADNPADLFSHLLRREGKRQQAGGAPSRFEEGSRDLLLRLREQSLEQRVEIEIFVVQPGLAARDVSAPILRVLGATENYLNETYQMPLVVIGNRTAKKDRKRRKPRS